MTALALTESRHTPIIPLVALLTFAFIAWARFASLDEVTLGQARVTPSSRSQLVQSLEGGIVKEIHVREGDVVEPQQVLVALDATRFESTVGELEAKARSLEATAARLEAEIAGREPEFSDAVYALPELVAREMAFYRSRRRNLEASTASLSESLELVRRELDLTRPLVGAGAASDVEVLRLERQENELAEKLRAARNEYVIDANAQYAQMMAELEVIREVMAGRRDQLERTVLVSPVRGIVNNLEVSTIGGVVAPGGTLMEIVPIEEQLLIETRVSPRDIAFIRPGLPATIKVTAYDPSIYGTLNGRVERISADTLQDEVHRDRVYYRVYIQTDSSVLETEDGKEHPIIPGMVATAEIRTGSKTVLDYLLKPVNKAGEALRER